MGVIGSKETVPRPWILPSDSRDEWVYWKRSFLTFLTYKYIPPYKQTKLFFKYTGYVGEEVSNNIYFQESKRDTKLEILLFKFDVYFTFSRVQRHENQSIDEYVTYLMRMAKKIKSNQVETIVKEKILQDFKSRNIFQQLRNRALYSCIIDYESLSLHELVGIWNETERIIEVQRQPQPKQERMQNRKNKTGRCSKCNLHHTDRCFAAGKNCYVCNELGHYARCCPKGKRESFISARKDEQCNQNLKSDDALPAYSVFPSKSSKRK